MIKGSNHINSQLHDILYWVDAFSSLLPFLPLHSHLNTPHGQSEVRDQCKRHFKDVCFRVSSYYVCPSFLISTFSPCKISIPSGHNMLYMHCSSQLPKFYHVGIETCLFTLPFWLASEILLFYTHFCPYCYHLFIVYLSHCLWVNPVEPSVLNHHIAKIEKGQEYRYFPMLDKVNDLKNAFAYYHIFTIQISLTSSGSEVHTI